MKKTIMISLLMFGISPAQAGLFSSDLSRKEMQNLAVCEKTETGVATFSFSILKATSILRNSGVKTVVSKSGSNLLMKIGGTDTVEIKFLSIDAKELTEDNITCYEVQNIKSEIDEFDRKDGTLDASTVASLKIFGIPLPTKKDKQLKKDKRAKEIAMHELEKQQKLDQEKLLEAKRVEIEREEKKQERLSKREKRKIVKEKQEKYLSMISAFETKSEILLLKESDDKTLILTDKLLDDLGEFLDELALIELFNKENGCFYTEYSRRFCKSQTIGSIRFKMDERYDESEYTRKRRQNDFYRNTYRDKIDKIVSGIKAMKE